MSQENDSKNSADIPPQYQLVPDPQQIEEERRAAANPGMRSPQSIVAEMIKNKDTSKSPIFETPEDKVKAAANPGMRSPKNLQAEQVALGVVEINTAENLSQMERQRRIIRQEQDREAARMAAQIEQRRRSFNRGQLRHSEMASVIERMKHGGGIQVPTFEENDRILREDETVLLEEVGGMTGMVGKLNKAARREANAPETKEQPNKELLQTAVAVPDELRKPVDQKKVAELLDEATAHPTEAMITKVAEVNQYLNENLATKPPTEILQYLQLDKFLKAEDIQIATQDGPRIDPVKRDHILNAVRLRLATEAAGTKGVGHVNEEIGAKYKGSREAADKIRAAIKKNTPATADEAADQKLHSYVELFKKRVQEEFTRANNAGKALPNDNKFRLPIAQEIVGQLESVLPDVTAEEFLAAVSVIESQENVQKASQDFQKKVFELYNAENKKGKLLEIPVKVKFKREDIKTNEEILTLIRNIRGNEPSELQNTLDEIVSYSGNLLNALKHFGLDGMLQPSYIRTEGDFEVEGFVDTDDYELLRNAIRLKYIADKQLFTSVDATVNRQLKSLSSENISAYSRLFDFSSARFPDAPAESKHLLENYRSEFQQMVDRELNRHNAISKALGKARATILPGDTYLANARHKAATEFVRTKQNELPPGMSADQFLAAMTIADTYKTAEDRFKKEVIEWYSKWYKKNVPAENNTGGAAGGERRRRVPNPLTALSNLRRRTPPEPPVQPPPTAPGNPPDNLPPGGNPPPEPPPTAPGSGGATAGGGPTPDNPPPTEPPDDGEDTFEVIVPEPPPHSDPIPAAVTGEPPAQNTVENALPRVPIRRSLRNELTPRKLSEQAVKLYKKSKERAQKAVKLAYEGSPYELTQGLLRSAVKIQDVETSQLIADDDFLNKLNDYRGSEGADIRRKIEYLDGEDILDQWGLEGHFDAETVKDSTNRDQLLDAIYIREISLAIFQANEEAFQEEIKKVSPQSLEQIQRFGYNVTEFLPQYLDEVANFQMDMLGRKMNLNPITAAQYMNQERLKIATKIFDENKFMMPEGATPEQFLAALSVVETFYQINNGIFNDLYEVYDQKEHPQEQPGNPILAANREKSRGKKLLNYDEKNGFLRTPIRIKRLRINQFGGLTEEAFVQNIEKRKQNDNFVAQLQQFAAGHNLYQIAGEFGLENYFTRNRIRDTEEFRNSEELIDLIIVKQASDFVFAENQDNLIGQLRHEHVPSKTIEAWQQLKDLPNTLFNAYLQRVDNARWDLITGGEKHVEEKLNKQRIDIARKIFEEYELLMPEGATPEQLLAAFSIQETLFSIKNKLFDDLHKAYLDSKNSGSEEDDNPPGNPHYPSGNSGGSGNGGPAPTPTPDQGGETNAAASSATVAEAQGPQNNHRLSNVRNVTIGKFSRIEDIQDRLRKLQGGNN